MLRTKAEPIIYRMLFLDMPSPAPDTPAEGARTERAFGFSLVFSAIRCILQYVVLPFVLPVFGIAADAAVPIVLAINLVAIASIVYSVRRMWRIDYKYKWQYLEVGIGALIILCAFVYIDLNPGIVDAGF